MAKPLAKPLHVRIGLKMPDGTKKYVIRSLLGIKDPDDKEPNETLEMWDPLDPNVTKPEYFPNLVWRKHFNAANLAKIAGEENALRAWVSDVCINGFWGKEEDNGN